MNHDSDSSHEDFGALERQLHSNRPVPTDQELDRARQRAVNSASARQAPRSRGRLFSPARLAMVSLVSGALLVGGSSASLAVSGLSSDGSAGIAQYVQSTVPNTDTGGVLPSEDQGGAPTTPGCPPSSARASQTNCPEDDSGTAPSLDDGDTEPVAESGSDPAQETKQVASGGSDERLPFTGFLALPLLLVGVLMLGAGFLLRTRASGGQAA